MALLFLTGGLIYLSTLSWPGHHFWSKTFISSVQKKALLNKHASWFSFRQLKFLMSIHRECSVSQIGTFLPKWKIHMGPNFFSLSGSKTSLKFFWFPSFSSWKTSLVLFFCQKMAELHMSIYTIKIFWKGHKREKTCFWNYLETSKQTEDFFKVLWHSQNIWTLTSWFWGTLFVSQTFQNRFGFFTNSTVAIR